jgi:hypothetical protein
MRRCARRWKPTISRATLKPAGARRCIRDGSTARLRCGWVRLRANLAALKVPTPHPEGRDRNHLPARPEHLRRALVECGLAAGTAQAGDQPELGQRGAGFGATLTKLGLEEDNIVELTVGGRKVKAPVIVAPAIPDNSVTVHLGYGRSLPAAWARVRASTPT